MTSEQKELFTREILIDKETIFKKVKELAIQISRDYANKKPLLVGVLRGSFIFLADLIREIDPAVMPEVDFIGISSYPTGTESSGQPRFEKDLNTSIEGRNVIIVEDIVDTGYSFKALLEILASRKPASLKTCSLLSKPARREVEVPIDYLGFTIPNVWIEGYGLDANQQNRGLKDITYRKKVGE